MILVTGATGIVGQHVVRELFERGAPVRAFVRDQGKAAALFGDDIELAVGDFSDAAFIRGALAGAETVYLAANGPRQVEYENRVIDAAHAAGVARIVKLSSRSEIGSRVPFWDWTARIERHLFEAEVPAVSVRATLSMANLLGSAQSVREQGKLFAPADGARIAWSHPQDVAAVAVVLLIEEGHEEQIYTVSGPEAVTYDEIAATLAAHIDRPVEFIPVSDEAAREGFGAAGLPDWLADGLIPLFAMLREGVQSSTTDTVGRLTGREPRTLAQFLADHADAFRRPVAGRAS
jgi:uncharacterized protein YbjT (DUF2867 family)